MTLSKIDFDALLRRFKKSKKRIVIDRLKTAVGNRLRLMVELNKSRANYLDKFMKMIEEYNRGSRNAEEFFKQLTDFMKELDQEDRRGMRESLSEEELALFDILTKPEMRLTEKERAKVKKVARELLERLKREKLVLDWKKHQQSRAAVLLCVEEELDGLPRTYSKDIWNIKCQSVFQHLFDSYQDSNHNVYKQNRIMPQYKEFSKPKIFSRVN